MTARDWADAKAKEILHKCRWEDAAYNAEVIALILRQAHAKGRAEAYAEAAEIVKKEHHGCVNGYDAIRAKAKEGV